MYVVRLWSKYKKVNLLTTMTKADLARAIYDRHGAISIREAARLVDIMFDRIRAALLAGEEVQLMGFGTLSVIERRPKIGRNLNTGEPVHVGVHRAIVFRPARAMKSLPLPVAPPAESEQTESAN